MVFYTLLQRIVRQVGNAVICIAHHPSDRVKHFDARDALCVWVYIFYFVAAVFVLCHLLMELLHSCAFVTCNNADFHTRNIRHFLPQNVHIFVVTALCCNLKLHYMVPCYQKRYHLSKHGCFFRRYIT